MKAVFDKNNTYDIFQHAVLGNGEYMFEPMLDKKRLKLKLARSQLVRHYMKIMLIINLQAVDRILLINARLKTIEISKALFLLDI